MKKKPTKKIKTAKQILSRKKKKALPKKPSTKKKKALPKKPSTKKKKALPKKPSTKKKKTSLSAKTAKKQTKPAALKNRKSVSKKAEASKKTSSIPPRFKPKIKQESGAQQRSRKKSEELTVTRALEELQKMEERRQEKKLILKDMEGRDYCLFEDCDFPAVSGEYCRLHYIGRWDYIRTREKLLETGFIEKKIKEILKKSSPSCITHFIGDFRSEKNFLSHIKPLLEDIDSLNEEDLFVKEKGDKDAYSEEKILSLLKINYQKAFLFPLTAVK